MDKLRKYEQSLYAQHLDEKVAALHLDHLSAELEELSEDQANYIGVTVKGPFKPNIIVIKFRWCI